VAELNLAKAHYLADQAARLKGFRLAFDGPFFNEFILRPTEAAAVVRRRLADAGFLVEDSEELEGLGVQNGLRIAVTERRSKAELDRAVAALGGNR
jgi:glycine dehydrogenase subunit 1